MSHIDHHISNHLDDCSSRAEDNYMIGSTIWNFHVEDHYIDNFVLYLCILDDVSRASLGKTAQKYLY